MSETLESDSNPHTKTRIDLMVFHSHTQQTLTEYLGARPQASGCGDGRCRQHGGPPSSTGAELFSTGEDAEGEEPRNEMICLRVEHRRLRGWTPQPSLNRIQRLFTPGPCREGSRCPPQSRPPPRRCSCFSLGAMLTISDAASPRA